MLQYGYTRSFKHRFLLRFTLYVQFHDVLDNLCSVSVKRNRSCRTKQTPHIGCEVSSRSSGALANSSYTDIQTSPLFPKDFNEIIVNRLVLRKEKIF